MPYTGEMSAPDSTLAFSYAGPEASMTKDMAENVRREEGGSPLGNFALTAALGVGDMADAIYTSTVGRLTGTQRGQISEGMLRSMGQPGLSRFYDQHRDGVAMASGIGGLVASEIIVSKFTKPGSMFMKTMRKLPFARRVAALDEQYELATAALRTADSSLAARGAMGEAQFTGRVTVDTALFDAKTNAFVAKTIDTSRDKLLFNAKAANAGLVMRHVALTEATSFGLMNKNEFLYTDDVAQNIAWQAFGLGIGGGLGWLQAGYQARKFANSDEIRRTFAGAMDPEGKEEARLLWHGRKVNPLNPEEGFLAGRFTDRVTSLLSEANDLKNTPVSGDNASELLANRNRLMTQNLHDARENMQKVTTKGITSNGYTRFDMKSPGYGNHVDMITHYDPSSMNGVEMLGGVYADEAGQAVSSVMIHETHMNRLAERIDIIEDALANPMGLKQKDLDALQETRLRLDYESKLTPFVYIDGEKMPITEAAAIEGFVETKVIKTLDPKGSAGFGQSADRSALFEINSPNGSSGASIDTDLAIHMKSGKDLDQGADHFDMIRLYRAGNQLADHLSTWTGPINMPTNPNWFQLDLAEQVLQRNAGAKIVWPQGMTRDSAQVESLVQKSIAMKKWAIKQNKLNSQLAGQGQDPESILSKLRVRFNLPKLSSYERGLTGETQHPVEALLRGIDQFGPAKVRGMSLDEIKEAVAQKKRLGDNLTQVTGHDVESLTGNSFRYMLDDNGNALKPLIGYSRPFKEINWSPHDLADRLAARKMGVIATLTDPNAGELSQLVTKTMIDSSDMQLAGETHKLMDTQIQGSSIGSAPQSFFGSLQNAFKSTEHIARDNATILAAARIRDQVERVTRDAMRTIIDGAFGGNLDLLKNPRNSGTQLLLNQFHSVRGGWDLEKKVITRPDGMNFFKLSDTAKNREMWRQIHPNAGDLKPNQLLVDAHGREVGLDQIGMDLQNRFNSVTERLIKEKNTILRANGMAEIDSLHWYVPPQNTNGKLIGMVIGPDGKPVTQMGIVASTPQEFEKRRQAMQPLIEKLGIGYVFRTQDEIKDFASIWDRVQMDMINPGTTAVQPGKQSRGALASPDVRLNSFTESLEYIRNGFLQHANDITETIFKEQINSAKARANIAVGESKNRVMPMLDSKYKTIHDIYQEALLGKSKLRSSGSAIAPVYNFVEGFIDKSFEAATPTASAVWDYTNAWINKTPWSKNKAAAKDFDALSTQLGKYMPFKDAAELMEARGLGAKPWTAAEVGAKMNQFTAATMLRVMEVAHPIMNLAGIVNAMPSVIRSFSVQAGEDAVAYAARVGHNANIFNLPSGQKVGILDMSKVGAKAIKNAWSAKMHPEFDYMVKRGYLSQEVAEFHRQFGSIESKGAWSKFFNGDTTIKNPSTVVDHLKTKGLVGWLSVLSDKSEDFSRSWGHMVGLELADNLGIVKQADRHAFANDIANKMIANYNPHNRAEIFQGAVGANIGLFQSFVQNYYQRMFRYIETADYGALTNQFVSQGALFGVTTIPGFKAFSSLMESVGDHEDTETKLRSSLGEYAGNLVGNGVIANIPTLFGLEGVDLYSRGDVSVRLPVIQTAPASVAMLNKIGQGIAEGIDLFWNGNQTMSATRLSEITSNMIANRPIAGMIQQFTAQGRQVDSYGQLVTETKGAMEAAYRVIGLRSQRQSNELHAFYANKNAMEHKAAADEVLRLATRAALREGRGDMMPQIFQKYVENGGDERQFRKWIKRQYDAGMSTRGQRQLKSWSDDPQKADMVARYLDAGVSIDEDEKTPDLNSLYGSDGSGESDPMNQSAGGMGEYDGQLTTTP